MARSSWHHYWRLMTAFSVLACGFFIFAAVGSGQPPGAHALAGAPPAISYGYYAFAQATAELLALFWGTSAVAFGLAWWACEMAWRERKADMNFSERVEQEKRQMERNVGVDVSLRD